MNFRHEFDAPPIADEERAALLAEPGFGRVFTDHMISIRFDQDRGWHDASVVSRSDLRLDPASAVLHYAQEIFEGLKAYRTDDGGAALFRPDANARRFRASAERLAMPPLPDDLFVRSLEELVRIDRTWIPVADGGALYLRPFMFGSEAFLGVRPSREYRYLVIASPVGSYFKGGAQPISVWVPERRSRAAPGGTGSAKCGGNYAASLLPHAEAQENDCDQVMFVDAVERRWIEELGGMNMFFVFADGTLRTPPLADTILAGVTRDSICTLARARNLPVNEIGYSIEDLRRDAASGHLREAFACGTAAVVAPVGRVRAAEYEVVIADGAPGPLTTSLREELVNVQRGRRLDSHGWISRVF